MAGRTLKAIIIPITSDPSGLERGIAQFARQANGVARTLGRIGTELATKITAPLYAARAAAIYMASQFQTSMTKIEALVGVNSEQVKKWGDQILDMAPRVARSPRELAEALYFVSSAGIEVGKAMDVVEVSARAASVGLGETQVLADAATSVMNAYGTANIDAATTIDILMKSVREGKGEATDYAQSLGTVVNTAAEMEVKFNDVGAAVAAYTLVGKTASEATTALNSLLLNFLKPAKRVQTALADVGTSAKEVREEIQSRGLLAALQSLREKFAGNEEGLARAFGRLEGYNLMLSLTGESAEHNAEIFKSLRDSTGTLDEAVVAASDSYEFKLNKAMAAWETLVIRIGNVALPGATSGMQQLGDAVERLSNAFRDLDPEKVKSLALMFGAAAAAGPAVLVLGKLVGVLVTVVRWIGTAIKVVGILAAGFAMLAGAASMGLVIKIAFAIITALAILERAWMTDFLKIKTITTTVVNAVTEKFDALMAHMRRAKEAVKDLWNSVFDSKPEQISPIPMRIQARWEIDDQQDQKVFQKQMEESAEGVEDFWTKVNDAADRGAQGTGRSLDSISNKASETSARMNDEMETTLSSISQMMETRWALDDIESERRDEMVERDAERFRDYADLMADNQQQWEAYSTVIADTVGGAFGALFEELDKSGEVLTSIVEGFRSFALRMLDMIATQLIAQEAAAVAASIAQAPFSLGASLAAIPGILGAVGPALLAIEAAKNVIPGLADGGRILRGGMVLVGERGPELLSLPAGAQVAPLAAGGAGAGGFMGTITLRVPLVVEGRVVAEAMVGDLMGAIRSKYGPRGGV